MSTKYCNHHLKARIITYVFFGPHRMIVSQREKNYLPVGLNEGLMETIEKLGNKTLQIRQFQSSSSNGHH